MNTQWSDNHENISVCLFLSFILYFFALNLTKKKAINGSIKLNNIIFKLYFKVILGNMHLLPGAGIKNRQLALVNMQAGPLTFLSYANWSWNVKVYKVISVLVVWNCLVRSHLTDENVQFTGTTWRHRASWVHPENKAAGGTGAIQMLGRLLFSL